MKNEQKSTLIYTFAGIIVGYVSFLLRNNVFAFVLTVAVLYGMYFVLQKLLKTNEKFKWFLSNGGWIYLFVWFITWTIFYNI